VLVVVFLVGLVAGALFLTPLWGHLGHDRTARTGEPEASVDAAGGPDASNRAAEGDGDTGPQMLLEETADPLTCRRTAAMRAAETVGPAVVSITVTQMRLVRNPLVMSSDPFERFWGQFFGGQGYAEVPGLGSGVIIDRRGIVVTNEHVVRDAREIKVSLPDGRTLDGTVISADRNYDLAVLRIEGTDLPEAPVGNSDDVIVGEWAIAMGNPFGFLLNDYQPTVTAGVISATHRDIKQEGTASGIYKDMIQTDAAINPGNSGGPLVNGAGEVIAINTFIFTQPGGGSVGVGFAQPINTVIRVVREILEYGRVRQVWIGLGVQEISGWFARNYAITDPRGLLVVRIEEGSPAARAGIKLGDIIRTVNGEPVRNAEEGRRLIFGAKVGDRIRLEIERQGRRWSVDLDLVEQPER